MESVEATDCFFTDDGITDDERDFRPATAFKVKLLQKIWYSDGTTSLQQFEASTSERAMSLAYDALDREIAHQWEQGRVTVDKAICDECHLVELLS